MTVQDTGLMKAFFDKTKVIPLDGRIKRQGELSRPLSTDQRRADSAMTRLVSPELLGGRIDLRA